MQLQELLADVDVLDVDGDATVDVRALAHDSRRVPPDACFACIVGATTDGHDHAPEAVANGAVALLVQRRLGLAVPEARVANVRAALGPAASRLHGEPSRSLRCLGVTGTNGKTTTTQLLAAIAAAAGEPAGLVGTVGARIDGDALPLEHTTPEAPELQELLARMRDQGVRTVALEVSSHALAQHRVDGTWFRVVCFTNLTRDHLDYHATVEDYFEAKALLFDPSRADAAAVNLDDPHGAELARRCRNRGLPVTTFAVTDPGADVVADAVHVDATGGRLTMVDGSERLPLRTPLLGAVNVENVLAAAVTARRAGFDPDAIAAGVASVSTIPGRLERVDAGQPFTVLVDYAHTPDALRAALDAARGLAGGQRVVVVFGCGGDRDETKRPAMGREAARAADRVIITSDNARSEDPAVIADAVRRGAAAGPAPARVELDRRAAIRLAVHDAGPGDVVLIAGKGHETTQQLGDRVVPFDDRVVAREEARSRRMDLTAGELAAITGGRLVSGSADARATSFTIDTRLLEPGGCFVALVAARDGHQFVPDAWARGATVVVATRPVPAPPGPGAVVHVDDGLAALARLGGWARDQLRDAVVIGVTGSAGKTATKDLTAAAVAPTRRVHASPASFNNEAGVPLTLLSAAADTEVVVVEMGARFAGNLTELAAIARPQLGIVTHVGLAHAEHLGGPAGVARVKGELSRRCPPTASPSSTPTARPRRPSRRAARRGS